MFYRTVGAAIVTLLLLVRPPLAVAQQSGPAVARPEGSITGTVLSEDGIGMGGAIVTLEPSNAVEYTDQQGAFVFRRVADGTYSVVVNIGSLEARQADVRVAAGGTATVAKVVPRDFRVVMVTTVSAASRALEQELEATSAVSVIGERTIALESGAGQIPALLQFAPGAEYAQSGVYNIEFNSRGFNGALSRRVQVLVDGRDVAAPESKNQEWIGIGFLGPELENIEFVRGPAAALYGADSVNGVVAMTTKSPRGSPGFRARVTTGDLETFIGDARWAGALGGDWFAKFVANHTRSGSFSRTRIDTFEYEGLPAEVRPALADNSADSISGRFDKYLPAGHQAVMEGGFTHIVGGTYLSQAGRVGVGDSKRSWGRFHFNATRWSASAYLNTRHAEQVLMNAPVELPTATVQFKAEVQGNHHFAGSRGRAIFGGAYLQEHIDSADSAGVQTLYQRAVTTKEPALFAQVEYQISEAIKAVGALRWDESTLHDAQLSPRAAVVYRPAAGHSIRASVNRGFQVGNYTEIFLRVPLAPPLDLSAVESAFTPFLGGVSLGLKTVPIVGLGNTNLDVEHVTSVAVGYSAILGSRTRVSVDVYRNDMRDFISDLLPGVNPAYAPYQAPAALPAAVRALVEQTLNSAIPGLTNLPDGGPQIVFSNNNAGRVTSRGLELAGAFRPVAGWSLDSSYTWFDFTLVDPQPGLEPKPNAPRHRVSAGVTFDRERFAASFRHRWVQGFDWASGVFVGPVPGYHVSDLNARYDVTEHWQVGGNISNLFDRRHYEMFGGDILQRRALVHLTTAW